MEKIFWENRWNDGNTGWDLGEVSAPLKAYFDQLSDQNITVLIPGCGNAYEAEYLYDLGFKNVYTLDFSDKAIEKFIFRAPKFPKENIIKNDFFTFDGSFDLIIEQTFFCAIHPDRRHDYIDKMYELLSDNGKLVGVLFNNLGTVEGPPFDGNMQEYKELFETNFTIDKMEECYNSIKPRAGKELFFQVKKKLY